MKKKSFLKEYIRNNSVKYIACIVLLVIGVCIGSSSYINLNQEKAQLLVNYFSDSVTDGKTAVFTEVFKNCLLSNMKYILVYFLFSTTVYISWACLLVGAAKGFATGFTSAFLILNYASNGVAYVLLAVVPSLLLVLPVHCFTASVCINFAADRHKRGDIGARAAMGIVPALLIIYTIMCVCSLFDAVISPLIFENMF